MGAQEFGALVEAERRRKGWTRSKLAVMVGILDDGTALDATQIRRIVEGTRKLDQDTVRRIIQALDLPDEEADAAWFASGLWPPGLSVEGYRRFKHLAVVGASSDQPNPKNGRSWRPADRRFAPDRRRRDRRGLRVISAA